MTFMGPREKPDPSAPALDIMSPRRLIVSSIVVIALMVALVAAAGMWLRDPLMRVSRQFVESFGGVGVALGYFIPDAFAVPLPNDLAPVLARAGGMGFLEVTLWATGGSLAGGAVGYWIGRSLRTTRYMKRMLQRRGGAAQEAIDRYGAWAVAIAALTPIPYSIFVWAAGAGKMPFKTFLLISQLRWLRVAGYLYLIQLGLFSVGV